MTQICPEEVEKFVIIPPPTNQAALTDEDKSNVADFNRFMGPKFFDTTTPQTHINRTNALDKENEEEIVYTFDKTAAPREWDDFEATEGHRDTTEFGAFLPLPAIVVHRKIDFNEDLQAVRVEQVKWGEVFNDFIQQNTECTATPVSSPAIQPEFATTNKKGYNKLFFAGYGSMKPSTVEAAIKKLVPDTLFIGFHTTRGTNASNGYGFLFLKNDDLAKKLIKFKIPLRTGGGAIVFDWAKKKKGGQVYGGHRGGRGGASHKRGGHY